MSSARIKTMLGGSAAVAVCAESADTLRNNRDTTITFCSVLRFITAVTPCCSGLEN